jgi:signal transduction histidine kinase
MTRFALLTVLCSTLLSSGGISQVNSRIDSLENLVRKASPEERVEIFCQISELYWQRSYDTSLIMAIHAHNVAEELGNPSLIATSLYMIGNAYYLLGDFPNSMDHYLRALELREKLGDSSDIASSYNNIGAVYLHMNDKQKALEYFKKSGSMFRALGDDYQLFPILNNIGAVYVDNRIFDTAYQYFHQAYEVAERDRDKTNLSIALANLGETALPMGLYAQSEEFEERAYEISSRLGDKGMMATVKSNLGKLYLRRKEYSAALEAFQESLVLAREVNSLTIIQENYKNLADYYSSRGDDRQALRMYRIYSAVKDSLLSQEGMTHIREMELKFNARSLQQEIELLRKDNTIQSLKQTRLRNGIISLAVVILALILVFVVYYQRSRFKRETAQLLEVQNRLLEKANRKLHESEAHLKELNSTKDKFFSIIGHDLRNPLNALLGFSELISGNSREYSFEEIQKYSKIINEAAKNIHMLIENLLEWSRTQSGNIEFNPEEIPLEPIVGEIVAIFEIQAEKKDIAIEVLIKEGTLVYADKNLLSTILRNLVNNAVKYTSRNGKVLITGEPAAGGVNITVKDTGLGMTEDQLSSLFSLVHGPSTPGTAEEKGTGLGLILCKEFVDKHKGEIRAESQPGEGSTFTLLLPNKK